MRRDALLAAVRARAARCPLGRRLAPGLARFRGRLAGMPDRTTIGEAAVVGAAVATVLMAADLAARAGGLGWAWLDAAVPLAINVVPRAVLAVQRCLHEAGAGGAAAIVAGGAAWAALLAWRRTRSAAGAASRAILTLAAAWGVAAVFLLVHTLHGGLGLAAVAAAVPPALLLARLRVPSLGGAGVFAGVAAWAMVYPLASADDRRALVQPVPEYLAVLAVGLLAGWAWSRFADRRPAGATRRRVTLWGVAALVLATAAFTGAFAWGVRPRPPSPHVVIDAWAYDLALVGSPPRLVWADKTTIHAMIDPYGARAHRVVLDAGGADYPQRIWPSAAGGFFVQNRGTLSWWAAPEPHLPPSPEPAFRYALPLGAGGNKAPSPYGVYEDLARDRLFVVGEWWSEYAFLDRATGQTLEVGRLPGGIWPYWQVTPDPSRRAVLLSSCAEDGGVVSLDLDTGRATRVAENLFAYRIVPDAANDRAWAVRPGTGELLELDPRDFRIRRRQHLGWGVRELQVDPRTGALYTCTLLEGEVLAVEPATGDARSLGRCGRYCRHLFVDAERRSLWAATRDGICRFDLP